MTDEEGGSEKVSGGANGKRKIFIGVLLIGVLLAACQFLPLQQILKRALEWIRGFETLAPLVFTAAYILSTVLFLPGSVLTLGAGFLFGILSGTVVVSVASTLGAAAAFLIGRYAARDWVEKKLEGNQRFRAVDRAVGQEGWKIVLLTRLSPVFPFNLLNYAYGVTRVSLRGYLLASWLGMIPGTVLYVYLGSLAGSLATIGTGASPSGALQWAVRIVGFLATVSVTVYVTRVARRALREKVA